jgi:hypothetical protein
MSAACHEHIELRAPESSAPEPARLRAYQELAPLSYHETQVAYVSGYGFPVGTVKKTDYLQLADGRRVYYAEDILPVVPDDSPAALAANDSSSNRHLSNLLYAGGVAAIVAGAALMVAPFVTHDPASQEPFNWTPALVGLGISIGGGVGLLSASSIVDNNSQDQAASAFETYEPAVRKKLALCRDGDRVYACR